jgi:hypothetical protein
VQDIIGEEVVSFMMTTGSVKEDDISGLESRIRDRILGQKVAGRRFKGPTVGLCRLNQVVTHSP